MNFVIKANDLKGSYFEGGAKNYEGIKCVPSALMRTTSYDFGREINFSKPLGVYELDITNSVGVLNINQLVGYFKSTNGKHFVELHVPINLDLSGQGNNDYILAFYPKYYKADVIVGSYPYTELIFEVVTSSETPTGIKLADITISSGEITAITPITVDSFPLKFREMIGVDDYYSKNGGIISGNVNINGSLEVNSTSSFNDFVHFEKAIELSKNTSTGNPRIQFADVSTDGLSLFLDMADRLLKIDNLGTVFNLWTSENFNPDDKANTTHTHNISDVTNLQSELDSKPTGEWSFDGSTLTITI